jgi:YVTN family beta-propeller protein
MKVAGSRRKSVGRVLLACAVVALAVAFGSTLGAVSAQPTGQGSVPASDAKPKPKKKKKPKRKPAPKRTRKTWPWATTSSPIALSLDNRLLWVVNPKDDSVSVIRTDTNAVLRKIQVGDEPRSIALDANNRFAYVANAAAGSVSVIRIANATFSRFRAGVVASGTTGAEPWNVVVSPDGKRVFVANSGQDTITVINTANLRIIGNVDLRNSLCNDPDRSRHFQPRGLAVSLDNRKLFVTRFFSFTRSGGRQADDNGREGAVCRLDINTSSNAISGYRPAQLITLAPRVTGFQIDANGDGTLDDTSAFPNQLQSIVIRGDQAYLPNIAASPSGPLRFNVDTQAFVNVIDGVRGATQTDASAEKFLNLHLGAREPEPGKKRLFFANPWAIAFTTRTGAGAGYVVSAGSDLLVKVNVAADGKLSFTVDANTTRYIDLNNPDDPATSGRNAGKNPQGIAINSGGTRAYTMNVVSRNVSVVDLTSDRVIAVVQTAPLPAPGSPEETRLVGAEVFFSSRGNFNRPAGTTVSTTERLSSEGWQSCASCHFEGLTDGVVWAFGSGPRKSVPLNGSFNPHDPNDQRVLNYSAIFDEIEDFEINIRNVSGPGPLATPVPCSEGAPNTTNDPNHGLLIGDNGNINLPPCVINAFAKANANRPQLTVTLPGSSVAVPALTAMRDWVRFAIRTPNGPLVTTATQTQVQQGRELFQQAGCTTCHFGGKWTLSTRDFTPPPAATEIFTERTPPPVFGNPVGAQYLNRFLRDIGSFNLGVPGSNNPFGNNIGGAEKNETGLDALGIDYNNDGKGIGFNVPSLLGIYASPPYYHNGACETLACVLSNVKHRTANGRLPDRLADPAQQAAVVRFLETIDADTAPLPGP